MHRFMASIVIALGVITLAADGSAQQPAAGGRGGGQGRGGGPPADATPVLVFKETWKLPYNEADITPANRDQIRRVKQEAVTNPNLELKLYGGDAAAILATEHEGRVDIWNGMATTPIAVTLRDRTRFFDVTGRARLRMIIRTNSLHRVFPVVKLANGTMLVGDDLETGGEFVQLDVAFNTRKWYQLDPKTVTTTAEVENPDFSRVDEIGWADLSPGGGHNSAGWTNVSHIELWGKAVPRAGSN
jgi:hypothetical protein